MSAHAKGLALRIKMSDRAVAHLPLFVEVTLANTTDAEAYEGLAACNPWSPPFPVELAFTSATRRVTLPARSEAGREEPTDTFDLAPGEARTWVLDVSELDTPIAPGAWHCAGRWLMRDEHPRSAAVNVVVGAARPGDVPLLERLRLFGQADSPTWANLIEARQALDSPEFQALSGESRRALAPYAIIHHAIHGRAPLAQVAPEPLSEVRQGPWASEAAVLRYELAWARRDAERAGLRRSILTSWPGVAFRLDEIERGAGYLTALRHRVGPGGGQVR